MTKTYVSESALDFSEQIFDSYLEADEAILCELKNSYTEAIKTGAASKRDELAYRKVLTLVTAALVLKRHPGVRRVKYVGYDDLWVCRVCGCGAVEPDLLLHQPCKEEV